MNAPNATQETAHDEPEVSYDAKAVKLVLDGLRVIRTEFESAQKRGLFPKGRQLVEVVHDTSWTIPALLDEQQLSEFIELVYSAVSDDILRAIWYILENVAHERRLMPALVINRETGFVEARLTL